MDENNQTRNQDQGSYDAWSQSGYRDDGAQNAQTDIGSFSMGYGSGADGQRAGTYTAPQAQPPQKSKVPAIVLLALGVIFLLVGAGVMLFGANARLFETQEAVDIYDATAVDQYVYTPVQYMTESVAYYESMEHMQFYIAFDEDWYASVVCIHDDEMGEYQKYIDWLYDDESEGAPDPVYIEGYAQPFDRDLKEYVLESFEAGFGEGYVDMDSFEDMFGPYYIQVGQKNSAFGISNIGLALALAGLVLAVVGAVKLLKKPQQAPAAGNYTSGPIIEAPQGNVLLGILGAFIGAALGGLIWTGVGILGVIVGWVGVITILLSYGGYKLLARKESTLGVFFSVVFSIAAVLAGHYMTYAWLYYKAMNESIGGYTSLGRAVMELGPYLSSSDSWGDFWMDLVKGLALMLVAGIYFIIGSRKKK